MLVKAQEYDVCFCVVWTSQRPVRAVVLLTPRITADSPVRPSFQLWGRKLQEDVNMCMQKQTNIQIPS